jgi:hypothetical protein
LGSSIEPANLMHLLDHVSGQSEESSSNSFWKSAKAVARGFVGGKQMVKVTEELRVSTQELGSRIGCNLRKFVTSQGGRH